MQGFSPKFTSSDTLLFNGDDALLERTMKWKGRGLYCFGLIAFSLSLVDNVDSLDPSVSASELGEDSRMSPSNVTEEREDRSDGVVGRLFSLVFLVSQESQ